MLAVVAVGSVWIGPQVRPCAVGFVAASGALSVIGAPVPVMTLLLDTGVGVLAGALVALALRTRDRTPTPEQLGAPLDQSSGSC